MPLVNPQGSPSARIWFVFDAPFPTDVKKGYMCSGGAGYVFTKMLQEAGITDYYIIARRPDSDAPDYAQGITDQIARHKVPFIVPLGAAGQHICKTLLPLKSKDGKEKQSWKTPLSKYVGSLLECNGVMHKNYLMPIYGVDVYIQDWQERQVVTYFDLQKLREEYAYWRKNGHLQPLPFRSLIYQHQSIESLLQYFDRFKRANLLSVDIETCYPKADSAFFPHPGYALTVGIADSPEFGLSFNLWREDKNETKILWRELAELLHSVPNLGQNYFNFDAHHLQMLGFEIQLKKVQDTLIRHHILWPELPHKLQFQTRQYTREVYYKDDGHHWNLKNMDKLRRYNCLDVCVTYEIFLEQEKEFALRESLR